ncbi:MAG: AraC family transcriptional regulator [Bacteroidota bacterium]
MSTYNYFLTIALGQGFLLAFFLLTSKYYKSTANTCLAIGMILISFLSITDILCEYYLLNSLIFEFLLNDLSLDFLLYLPFYYYFQLSTKPNKKIVFNFCWLIPFAIDTFINIYIVSFYSPKTISNSYNIQFFYNLETLAVLIFNLILCYKAYKLIKTNAESNAIKDWLFKIWLSTLIIILVWIVMSLIYMVYTEMPIFIFIIYVTVALWLFWFIYTGVVNLNLLNNRKDINLKLRSATDNGHLNSHKTIEKTNLRSAPNIKVSPEKLNEHFEKINSILQNEHLYRDENLSVADIGQRVGMSIGYISKIIKKATDKNFPSWINEFRVEEVKTMLSNEEFENYTTLAIGLEAGFKSKSAFYTSFKKVTGVTPASFRKIKS